MQGRMVGGACVPAWSPGWMGDAATGTSVRARLSSRSHVVSGGWRPSSNRPSHGLRALKLGYGCMASLAEAWSCVS